VKGFFIILGGVVLVLFGCSSPTSSSGGGVTADVGNSIVQSLTVDNVSPVSATASRSLVSRALVSGTSGYASQEYNNPGLQPPSISGIVLRLFKGAVGTGAVPLGVVTTFPAVANVSTGPNANPSSANIGASQIKIVPSSGSLSIYWRTTLDLGAGPTPTLIQVVLENFTAGTYTDYKKISTWIQITGFTKTKAICDFSTGDSVRYTPPSGFSGEVTVIGKANGGIYLKNVRVGNLASFVNGTAAYTTIVSAFGDGNRLVIKSSEPPTTGFVYGINVPRYLVNDVDVSVAASTLTSADKTFLDNGMVSNHPASDWNTVSASGTEYYRLFGSGTVGAGAFDTELVTASVLP